MELLVEQLDKRAASVWAGFAEMEWQPNLVFPLVRTDPGAVQLHHDLRVLMDVLKAMEPDNPARRDLECLAETSLITIGSKQPRADWPGLFGLESDVLIRRPPPNG